MTNVSAPSSIVPQEKERWVLITTIVASSMVSIGSTALNVALPALQKDLNVTGTELLWIINAFALFLSALILVGGSLGDHYGRKRVFTIGIILFTLASVVCGLAPNTLVLIMARAVQGIGGALLVPGSLAILSASFSAERRGAAIGLWSTFSALMVAVGPVLGGWLAGQGLWRVVFFLNVPFAILTLVTLTQVPESRDQSAPDRLDWSGSLMVTLGLAGITYGFIQAPDFGFTDWRIVGSLLGGAVALIAFVWIEAHSDHPIVPLTLFRSRTFSGTNLLTLFLYAALNGALFFLPLNLIQVQGYPEQIAGLTLLPLVALLTLMSRWAGGLVDRIGARLPLTIGPAIAGVGMALFALPGITRGAADYWTTFLPPLVVMGVGMGITVAPLTTAVMGSAPATSAGTASGINNAVSRSAGVLAVAIMGAIALFSFGNTLQVNTADLMLSEESRIMLQQEARNLGGATAPDGLTPQTTEAVEMAIKASFVTAFRLLMVSAAVLCWLSALLAALFVEGKQPAPPLK